MLVTDNIDIDTLGYRLSPLLCRGSVNSPSGVMGSQPHSKAILSGREEVEFWPCLKRSNTHNSKEIY